MKKTENFCICALCAIFVGVVLGCSGGGGDGGEMGGGSGGLIGGEPTADICGLVHEDIKHPAYMNVTGDFEGQRFVESNADWFYDGQYDKNTKFDSHYDDADKYINCKVAELNELWQEKKTGSALSNQIGTVLSNFNNKTTISQNIDNNYNVLAPIFKMMINSLTADVDYNRFNVSYWQLAGDAYNQSLGLYANETRFETNAELRNKSTNFFVLELSDAELDYADATNSTNAKTRMSSYLLTIANNTNTDVTVLRKVVELALYNESLYGLNDYAVMVGVNSQDLTKYQRRLAAFRNKISNATYSVSNIQHIEN